jgi:hypothetical protein
MRYQKPIEPPGQVQRLVWPLLPQFQHQRLLWLRPVALGGERHLHLIAGQISSPAL